MRRLNFLKGVFPLRDIDQLHRRGIWVRCFRRLLLLAALVGVMAAGLPQAQAAAPGQTEQTRCVMPLGHGISDVDTAVLLKLQRGAITPASIAGVVKGLDGRPGELRGAFSSGQDLGALYANTTCGVFGHLKDPAAQGGTPVPVARPQEVRTCPATIRSNVSGTQVEEYAVEIVKVYERTGDSRDLMLKVTDPHLLAQTGGIVQGMSGSPILQDGKLVGAVTHVLIDHADRGYDIFAQRMLEQTDQALHT